MVLQAPRRSDSWVKNQEEALSTAEYIYTKKNMILGYGLTIEILSYMMSMWKNDHLLKVNDL